MDRLRENHEDASQSSNKWEESSEQISETTQTDNQEITKPPRARAIQSFAITMIPILLWGFCFLASDGSTSEADSGIVWIFIGSYYASIGIPLTIVSIVFGIDGLKTKLCWLSVISLLIKAATIIAVIFLCFIRPHLG